MFLVAGRLKDEGLIREALRRMERSLSSEAIKTRQLPEVFTALDELPSSFALERERIRKLLVRT